MNDNKPLSPEEQQALDDCVAIIRKGPQVAEVIGPAIDRIEREGLYRAVANIGTLLALYTGMEPDDGLRLLEEWRGTAPGSADLGKPQDLKQSDQAASASPKPAPEGIRHEEPAPKRTDALERMRQKVPSLSASPPKTSKAASSRTSIPAASGPSSPAPAPNNKKTLFTQEANPIAGPRKGVGDPAAKTSDLARRVPAEVRPMQPAQNVAGSSDSHQQAPNANAPGQVPDVSAASASLLLGSRIDGQPNPASCVVTLPLSAIKTDSGIQSRVSIKKATIRGYAERMKAGDHFPPMDVFDVDGEMLVADGFQRRDAHQLAKHESVPVIVHQGSRRDAIKFGIHANSINGTPYSNADKRRAVKLMIQNFPGLSDGAYAEMCKASQPFVSKVHRQLKTVLSCEERMGRDGKKRRLPRQTVTATTQPNRETKAETDREAERTASKLATVTSCETRRVVKKGKLAEKQAAAKAKPDGHLDACHDTDSDRGKEKGPTDKRARLYSVAMLPETYRKLMAQAASEGFTKLGAWLDYWCSLSPRNKRPARPAARRNRD
jgi:hypothetical protein